MISTYASARADVAAAVAAALPSWIVFDHPADSMGDYSIGVSVGESRKTTAGRWERDLIVGAFVVRSAVSDALDALDVAIPTIVDLDLDGYTVGNVTEPRTVTVGDVAFLAQFIPATIETTG